MDVSIRDFVSDFLEGSDWSERRLVSFHEGLENYHPKTELDRAWQLLGRAKLCQISRAPISFEHLDEATKIASALQDQKLITLCEFEYALNHFSFRADSSDSIGHFFKPFLDSSRQLDQRLKLWLVLIIHEDRATIEELEALAESFDQIGDKVGAAHALINRESNITDISLESPSSMKYYDIQTLLYCRTNQVVPIYIREAGNLMYDMAYDADLDIQAVERFYRRLNFESSHPLIQSLGAWCGVFENLGLNYSIRGDIKSAEYWLNKGLDHAKRYASESYQISVLNEIAHHYARLGDAETTLRWSFEYAHVLHLCATNDAGLVIENSRQAHLIEIANLRQTEMQIRTNQLEDKVAQRTQQLEQEIARRRQAEEEAYRIAFHSEVTGLLNRSWMLKHIDQLIQPDQDFAACYIDLNGFKQINDRYSHAAGDDILRESAQRIKNACDAANITIHMSGDEFVVLAPGQTADTLRMCARRIHEAFQTPMQSDRHRILVGLSMGITSGHYREGDKLAFLESLLKEADLAMYSAKGSGGQSIVQFNEDLASRLRIEQLFLSEFETHLENKALEFYCQPQMALKNRQINGGELLVRWPHSEVGMIYPDQFIHLIKQRKHFDQLVMQSLPVLAALQAQHPTLKFSINLTATQLASTEFMNQVIAACASHGIAPERLTFELTESDLMSGESDAIDLMYRAKYQGFSFALDDIGKGHNSLLVFSQFPFDYIKIDRQLAQSAPTSKSAQAVIRGLVATCNSLGISTVIEGVETKEELAFAASAGIDSVQGFWLSTPLPIGEAFNQFVYDSQQALHEALINDGRLAL